MFREIFESFCGEIGCWEQEDLITFQTDDNYAQYSNDTFKLCETHLFLFMAEFGMIKESA